MINRIRDFFIWFRLWLEEPAQYTNIDQLIIYVLIACHFVLFYIVTLIYQFYFI